VAGLPPFPRPVERVVGLLGLALLVLAGLLPGPRDVVSAAPAVVLVRGDYLGENGLPNQAKATAAYEAVADILKRLNVPCVASSDSLVEREGLPQAAIAIFPYNRAMTDAEAERILSFMSAGGKAIVCFTGHAAVLATLGVQPAGVIAAPPSAAMAMLEDLPGVGETVKWPAECLAQATANAPARVLAKWQPLEAPAIVAGERGLFLTALPGDGGEQRALWRALLGRMAPALWQQMIETDPSRIPARGRFSSLLHLQQYAQRLAIRPACEATSEALQLLTKARQDLEAQRINEALEAVAGARKLTEQAFWQSYPSLPGELRGVWMSNTAEPSWRVATKSLADANFNAIFPYMMSGGVAFYNSNVLPRHPSLATGGDNLREAVAAAKAAGIPIHARMLNMTTLFAPADVRKALALQGRLMMTDRGKTSDWLCPSNSANRKMEVASALEMLAYGVDGIQFDYFRYPGEDTCFCPTCRKCFERDLGAKVANWPADARSGCYRGRFADWRREQLTSLVGEISAAIRQARPGAMVSAAVFLNWESHRENFGQDWKAWVDRGLVDFVCPMDYTTDPKRFELYVTRQEKWIDGKAPYAAGIGVHADGYRFTGPEMVLEQIRVAREHGSKGFVIFNYSGKLVKEYLPWLKLGATAEPTEFLGGRGG
jgi:uncharacterized lipoprotein YddW (UPF0748 family)